MNRALPVLLLVAACTQPPPPAPVAAAPPPTICAAHEGSFPALIGMSEAEVRSAVAAMPGIRTVRAAGPYAPAAQDSQEDRATLVVQGGRVIRMACG